MKFNNEKFNLGQNGSVYYHNWDKEMLKVFEEVGSMPVYDSGVHYFSFRIKKDEKGKRKRFFKIICPTDTSEIYVKYFQKMDIEEMKMASDLIMNFIFVMTKYGYIY